jgi:integrase
MNLRETNRSRRVSMTNLLLLTFMSEEGQRRWGELLNMEWDNYDDFEKKYGSDFNLDNFAKRQSTFYLFDTLGSLLKSGLADRDTLYTVTQVGVPWTWAKFKSVLMENRRLYAGRDAFKDFEYLADEMMKMKMQRDPSYKVPETFARYVTVK